MSRYLYRKKPGTERLPGAGERLDKISSLQEFVKAFA
jgi:hypothetical protein